MKLIIEIPKEFEANFENDKFSDSLYHVAADIDLNIKSGRCGSSGRHEIETIAMLQDALRKAEVITE